MSSPLILCYYLTLIYLQRSHTDCFDLELPVCIGNEAQLSKKHLMDLAKSHPAFKELLGDLKPDRFKLKLQPGYKVIMTYIENKRDKKARKASEMADQ